jgi:hypothetical protein
VVPDQRLTHAVLVNGAIRTELVKEKERQTLEKMQNAKAKVRNEIRELKDRLKLAQENMQLIKEKVDAEEMLAEEGI